MIKWIRLFVVVIFLIFFALYVKKILDYENVSKLFSFENKIDNLGSFNHFLNDEIEKIVGYRYVNYDDIIENIKKFKKSFEEIKKDELVDKIGLRDKLEKVYEKFEKEMYIIERIIQESAVIKSSFLYLPSLEKEIMVSGLRDKKVIESIHEVLEILSYQIFLRDKNINGKFYEKIDIIKNFKTDDKKLANALKNFYNHSMLIYNSIGNLTPLLINFQIINKNLTKTIDKLTIAIYKYEENLKKRNLFIEGLLHSSMFIFAGMIFYLINKEQKIENELKRMAEYDYLTGLPNRYRLLKDLKNIKKLKKWVYIVRFDIDNFAYINEKFGTAIGDKVLRFFTEILNKHCPKSVYRVTSDEFVALCKTEKEEDILYFFKNLSNDIKKHSPYYFTISAGAYKLTEDFDIEKLNYYLHSAIYSAKKRGGDNLVFYSDKDFFIKEYQYFSNIGTEIKKEIEESIKEDRFFLCFQPIWKTKEKKIVKYEVLVRLQKNNTIIPPVDFIELAEKFNLIGKITRIVIKKAFRVFKEKRIPISINLSALDILDETLIEFIVQQSKNFKVENRFITFEVTETAVVNDIDKGIGFIKELRKYGFKFAIDDFGVGYSSLKYIYDMPVDYIKIDGSFIRKLDKDENMKEFVKNINTIIKSSNKLSIAEYVENEKILKILEEIGVDYAQGYFIGKPSFTI
ncbi:EAL domain-containing protein [Nitrosophilus labii]|uniref:EAL domain-containing protein n=1 Tax=Nitrosophilus labii TaxID=2706014 RepID=UPI001656C860|nr:EAL domain-containing protein [Nitrosophilus labii]